MSKKIPPKPPERRRSERPFSIGPKQLVGPSTRFGHPHRILLNMSKHLISQGHYMSAVVIAQTGCEIFAEVTISTIIKDKGLEYLDQPISQLLPNYNLKNERVRKLYTALSGDRIQDALFWVEYVKMVELRNKIVHKGKKISMKQAGESHEAAKKIIEHLEHLLRSQYPSRQWVWKDA